MKINIVISYACFSIITTTTTTTTTNFILFFFEPKKNDRSGRNTKGSRKWLPKKSRSRLRIGALYLQYIDVFYFNIDFYRKTILAYRTEFHRPILLSSQKLPKLLISQHLQDLMRL